MRYVYFLVEEMMIQGSQPILQPLKSWYLGGELGILLGWVWLLSLKTNPFWFIPDLTVLFSFCITFAAEADNGELKSIAKCQGKKSLRPSLYDDSFKRDLTALWVSVMFHKSIGDTDHHPVTFKHSDLTSFL